MIPYLFKSVICLGLLLLVYLLFLEKEKMHRFNRWYLIGSILFAFLVPLISFTVTEQSLPVLQYNYFVLPGNTDEKPAQLPAAASLPPITDNAGYELPVVWCIYILVTVVLLSRFTANMYSILSRAAKSNTIPYKGARLVLLKENTVSYSFLHYIFISEEAYANRLVEEEVITHELTHVQQKHSWDVIFLEFIHCIFWFNPLFIFYKKAIQLNHEYLADDAVIKTYADVTSYQYLLLDKASCACNTRLTSNFNYSVTKKRLIMLTKTTHHITAFCKKIAVVPIACAAILLFSAKNMIAQNVPKQKQSTPPPVAADSKQPEVLMNAFIREVPHTTAGVSQEKFAEYLELEKAYLKPVTDIKGNPDMNLHPLVKQKIPQEIQYKMEDIFVKMSREQQSKLHVIFMRPPGPFKAATPSEAQFEKWKDASVYGVWIGDKKVKNEELNNYTASDFPYYNVSKLYPNAKKGKTYTHQLNLMTREQFNANNEQIKANKHLIMGVFNYTQEGRALLQKSNKTE